MTAMWWGGASNVRADTIVVIGDVSQIAISAKINLLISAGSSDYIVSSILLIVLNILKIVIISEEKEVTTAVFYHVR